MEIVDSVFNISEDFMKKPIYVKIDPLKILQVVELMKETGFKKFDYDEKMRSDPKEVTKVIYLELVGNAINYCYWYGRHDIRPSGSSSRLMYKLLVESFDRFGVFSKLLIDNYISKLVEHRFPLLEDRVRHLYEIVDGQGNKFVRMISSSREHIGVLFETLSKWFPGYGSDIFLKRVSLFFIQLNRNFGWYEQDIYSLPIPADYQIPKMLRYYKCIVYSDKLQDKIDNHELIPKHSLMECEIRAATVLVSKRLSELTGWSVSDVDSWFWLRRNECKDPFHLTITTDY